MKFCVYEIRNKVSGESYIGYSKDPKMRFSNHMKQGGNRRLRFALKAYGKESFSMKILLKASTQELAEECEKALIAIKNPYYNMMNGKKCWGKTAFMVPDSHFNALA